MNVTKSFLPPLSEYVSYLEQIWSRGILTNQGPLVSQLELKLKELLKVQSAFHAVANGGLALQIGLKALGVTGEVVTTPFSYVATSSCPLWDGCSVIYADVESDSLCLSPESVEAAITSETEAIIATHVFGNPCQVDAFEKIASKHGLALIFDAAHAFGVEYEDKSILDYGDLSIMSFHATKLFHSIEGGAIVSKDAGVAHKAEWMRRYGHDGFEGFLGAGINGKLSEVHAAMGLCNLKYYREIIEKRAELCQYYDTLIGQYESSENQPGVSCRRYIFREDATRNYSYYPVIFESEAALLEALERFDRASIYPRRYFFPSLDNCQLLSKDSIECPTSRDYAKRTLCLPLSTSLSHGDIDRVVSVLFSS